MNEHHINIYLQNCKLLKLAACGLFFIALGVFALHEDAGLRMTIVGWGSLVFGIVGELSVCYYAWIHAIGKPMLIIGDEELKVFVPSKRKYKTVLYNDVEMFYVVEISGNKYICVSYVKSYVNIEDVVINDVMFGTKRTLQICDMLNEKLKRFQDRKT